MSKTIAITALKAGFRRCGVAHPAERVEHPAGRFSQAEIARLKAEPQLVVEEIEAADDAAGKAAKGGKGGKAD